MRFIDCNASIGDITARYYPLVNPSLQNHLALMQRYAISQSLCSCGFCVNGDIDYGNMLISQWANNNTSIAPVFTALPEKFTPFDRAKAMKIFPRDMVFPLSKLHIGGICAAAAERELPILLPFSQTDVHELTSLLSDFPENNFILTEIYYRNIRNLYPLLKTFANLYIETSFLKTWRSLEFICEHFGAGRLIFGTGSPYYDAGAAIAMVLCADITQDEKETIAYRNIASLCRLEVPQHDN